VLMDKWTHARTRRDNLALRHSTPRTLRKQPLSGGVQSKVVDGRDYQGALSDGYQLSGFGILQMTEPDRGASEEDHPEISLSRLCQEFLSMH
jgi:hypothetical protein